MATGSKVHVYVKPKTQSADAPVGVVRTNHKGEIIAPKSTVNKTPEELDAESLKQIVGRMVGDEAAAPSERRTRERKTDAPDEASGAAPTQAGADERVEEGGPVDRSPDADRSVNMPQAFSDTDVAATHQLIQFQPEVTHMVAGVQTQYTVQQAPRAQEPQRQIQLDPYITKNEPARVMEAALFMSGQGLDNVSLGKLTGIAVVAQVQSVMRQLRDEYAQKGSAVEISEEAGGRWLMRVRREYAPAVRQFAGETEIPRHALKTLGFISKNEGMTKRDLFKKLGGSVYGDLGELEAKGFIYCIPHGRTSRVKTTQKFRDYFGI